MKTRELLGVALGGYEIERFLGAGSSGEVWRAFDRTHNRIVALKILHQDLASIPQARAAFQEEAESGSGLDHENVVRVYGTFKEDYLGETIHALVMECSEGESLEVHLAESERGCLAPEFTVQVMLGVARALNYAHGMGLCHRDIKPSNIVATYDAYRVQVADFGLAKIVADGGIVGTAAYLAPEAIGRSYGDERSDTYALGMTFYHLLYGAPPFVAEDVQTVLEMQRQNQIGFPDKSTFRGEKLLRKVIAAMCDKSPSRRPDLPSVISALEHFLGKTPSTIELAVLKSTAEIDLEAAAGRQGAFVGRTKELQAIHGAIGEGARLITLHGPVGIGKSRLAHAFLDSLHENREVWSTYFVSLQGAKTREEIVEAISIGIGLHRREKPSESRMMASLRSRPRLILVLDSVEHLLSEVASICQDILGQTRRVLLVTTSTEALAIEDERCVSIGPLSNERSHFGANIDEASPARELFEMRYAEEQGRELELSEDESLALDALVEELGGIPLGVEIAAAKATKFKPSDLLSALREQRDDDDPLRRAMAWSWDLLSPEEANLAALISEIEGSFTIDTIEVVGEACGLFEPMTVYDHIESLISKSLIASKAASSTGAELRFAMLKPIANFAKEQALSIFDPETHRRIRNCFHDHYLEMARELRREHLASHSSDAYLALQSELPTLMVIHDALVERAEGYAKALEILCLTDELLLQAGRARYLRESIAHLLANRPEDFPSDQESAYLLSKAHAALAQAIRMQGQPAEALEAYQEGKNCNLEYRELLGDKLQQLEFDLLNTRVNALYALGKAEEGLGDSEILLELSANESDRATAYTHLGNFQQMFGRAKDALESHGLALAGFKANGDPKSAARVELSMGISYAQLGEHDRAISAFESTQQFARKAGDLDLYRTALSNCAGEYCLIGKHEASLDAHRRVAAICRDHSDMHGLAIATGGIGEVHFELGNLEEAESSLGEAVQLASGIQAQHVEGYFTFILCVVRLVRAESVESQESLALISGGVLEVFDAMLAGDSVFQTRGMPDNALLLAGRALALKFQGKATQTSIEDSLSAAKAERETFAEPLEADPFRAGLVDRWLAMAGEA